LPIYVFEIKNLAIPACVTQVLRRLIRQVIEESRVGIAKSMILSVLGLLTPQDLRAMTHVTRQAAPILTKAAGAEGMFWEEESVQEEAQVLQFPPLSTAEDPDVGVTAREFTQGENPLEAIGVLSADKQAQLKKAAQEAYDKTKPAEYDLVLTERDRFRESEERIFKQNGLASYRKNSDLRLYRVTVTDTEGKEKTRITGTQGVLVDKKQA